MKFLFFMYSFKGGYSTVTLNVQLFNDKEAEWDMNLDEDPWIESNDPEVGSATITKGTSHIFLGYHISAAPPQGRPLPN